MSVAKMIALVVLLLAAAWTDVRDRRIPNALVFAGAVAGISLSVADAGSAGLWRSVAALCLGTCILLPAYAFRLMGAGDVKLVGAVGSFVDPVGLLGVLLGTFLVGGVMACAVALRAHAAGALARNLKIIVFGGLFDVATGQMPDVTARIRSVGNLPYAVAIAAGTAASLMTASLWRGG
jgi:prepilin peptidase CpaA